MGAPTATATVTVKNPAHCLALQAAGWSIGCGATRAFGWKRAHEVTDMDRATFRVVIR